MIYEWQRCIDSGAHIDNLLCLHCPIWFEHVDGHSATNCSCLDKSKKAAILSSLFIDDLGCTKCGKKATRDYPVYHIADSIISPDSGIPNPPRCIACLV